MRNLLPRRSLLALLATGGLTSAGTAQTSSAAPPFEVRTDTGQRIRLEDYRGKVLLLTFWATWCPHCRRQIAAMEKLLEDYKSKKIEMLALSVDKEGWQKVSPYLKEHKLSLSVALATGRIPQDYGASGGIPLSYVIDREGKVVKDFRGALDEDVLTRLGEAIARSL